MKPRSNTLAPSTRRRTDTTTRARATTPARSKPKTAARPKKTVQGAAELTTDQETIQRWAEERNGIPATVKATKKGGEIGILRIDFPGYSGEKSLVRISWDEWFKKFEETKLAFLYQEKTKSGDAPSRFFKLVKRPAKTSKK